MCGIKPCATCTKNSIGKMAKKKIRRRRRVGAIQTSEATGALYQGAFALIGSLVANIVGGAVNASKKKYISGAVQTIAGVGLALTKNKNAQAAGVGMLVVGGNNLLKDAGVVLPGMSGLQSIGYPSSRVGMPMVSDSDFVQV
jgi:hypothetical protein